LAFANVKLTTPKPETIYRITEVQETGIFYIEQAKVWKAVLEADKTNVTAWYNYFSAARYANIIGNQNNDLKSIATDMWATIPDVYESHIVQHWVDSWNPETFKHIEAAYALAPERYETYHSFITHYEVSGASQKAKPFYEKWFNSGHISNAMMAWNYNVLMSVNEDAILLTHGDNDTYHAWILQNVQGVQRNVKVVNINLLSLESYQNTVFKSLGIPTFTQSMDNFTSNIEFQTALVQHIIDNTQRPLYFNATNSHQLKEAFKTDLYVTGLASLHSKSEIDNISIIKNNVENRFITDYMKINLIYDRSVELAKRLNLTYLNSYFLLYKHYKESGEISKAKELKSTIVKIAKDGNRESLIKDYFGQNDAKTRIYPELNIKDIQKKFLKIERNIWAAETELTVEDYETFLMDLVKNRDFETIEICKTEKVNWKAFLNESQANLKDTQIFKNGHPDDAKMPIQSINYEAAVAYCKWLTEVYNRSEYKKKKFNKVIFRLPTEAEWEEAAKGRLNADYPWGGYSYTNAEGCYLSNFDVANDKPCEDCKVKFSSNDGGFFTVPADSYFPNNYGLYNLSGNVAEMTATKGFAKGGSWNDTPENCKVSSNQTFTKPSPKVGFRVFMEIVN
jgi:hypothetical protein